MFFLLTLICSYNFCVELTSGSCNDKCKDLPSEITILDHLPTTDEIYGNSNDVNVYVSESIELKSDTAYTNYNQFIACDETIEFVYYDFVKKMKIKSSFIEIQGQWITDYIYDLPAPVKIRFEENISLTIDSNVESQSQSIILEAKNSNLFIFPEYLSSNLVQGNMNVSSDSFPINIFEIDDNINALFKDTSKLSEVSKSYYCISDKDKKCSNYEQFNPVVINSPSEVTGNSVVLIVETSIYQVYSSDFKKRYIKFIGLEGSRIYYNAYFKNSYSSGEFHIIINENDITMTNSKYEGQGSFTLRTPSEPSLWSTTSTGSIDFTLKTEPYYSLQIKTLVYQSNMSLSKKIKVPEYSLFYGTQQLVELFEPGKYFIQSEHKYINTIDELTLPDVEGITYYFVDGEFEIPSTWNKGCTFRGSNYGDSNLNLIFKNAHSYSSQIDNYIYVFFSNLTIYPIDYFGFSEPYNSYDETINFIINGDVIFNDMSWYNDNDDNYNRKMVKENFNCNFKGTGTVKFKQPKLREKMEEMCTKEEKVIFEDLKTPYPDYYVCVGQSSLDQCKAEIDGIESITDVTWIWLVNIIAASALRNVKKIFITDKQYGFYRDNIEFVLTKNADFEVSDRFITINTNKVNNFIAQAKTAKLTFIIESNSMHSDYRTVDIEIKYEAAPTEIDFRIYIDAPLVKVFFSFTKNYEPNSVKLEGSCTILVRNYLLDKMDVFNKPDSISIAENTDINFECLCLANTIDKCLSLTKDFRHIISLDDVYKYDNNNYEEEDDDFLQVYIFEPLELTMDLNFSAFVHFYYMQGSSLNFDVPDKSRILFYLTSEFDGFEIINQNNKSQVFLVQDESVELVFNVKNTLYLDSQVMKYGDTFFMPKIEFKSDSNNLEIFPSIDFSSIIHDINSNYKITVPEGISISSPMPEYLNSLFESKTITFTGTCIYLNEEGKSLCGSKPSKSITEAQKEDIATKNVVIATGIDATFSIPSSWTSEHYLYFIRPGTVKLNLTDVSSLYYYSDGLQINEKCIIIAANITILVQPEITINVDLPKGYPLYSYMYYAYLDCGSNEQTNIYTGSISANQVYKAGECIHIGGYNQVHKLSVHLNSENDFYQLYYITYLYEDDEEIDYVIKSFSYICYASVDDVQEKCTEPNYFHASDVTSLIRAVNSFPDLVVLVTQNLVIPESIGKSLAINASDENIEVTMPSTPKSIQISENEQVQFNYDSFSIKAQNKMKLIVGLKGNLELNVLSILQSKMKFILNSDVLVSTQNKITEVFTIDVEKNGFHLYANDLEDFGNIFGDSIELYNKICAYEENADSLCTINKKDTIENVFKLPFIYNEVEIAISSNRQEITLPLIESNVNVVLKSSNSAILTIKSALNLQLANEKVVINDNWTFIENTEVLSVKLNKQSSISISESISKPITLQLTDADSVIDLKKCVSQTSKQITLVKFGEQENTITVLGSTETFSNFQSLIVSHEGIALKQNAEKKYLCICKDDSCNKCKEGIEGIITNSETINSDPGEDVEIRIFKNIEVESDLFTNEHNVMINSINNLTLKSVLNVYQNIEKKLKVDNLVFTTGDNLVIRPKTSMLYITMATINAGPEFTIEFSNYLVLNVTNAEEKRIAASKLYVKGNGELNIYDYPSYQIEADSTVKVIKGIYIICNSKAENSVCSYNSVENYKVINNYDNFENTFDEDTKIVVIIDSYNNYVNVEISRLKRQKMIFIHQRSSLQLLENEAKVRFLSTSVLTNKADSSTDLEGLEGGVSLSNDDSDFFVVAFNDKLTIKQEGEIVHPIKPIVIQPQSETASIIIDKNVKIDNSKIKIETEKEKLNLTVFVGDRPVNDETINNFIDISEEDKDKVSVVIKEGEPEEKPDDPIKPGSPGGKKGLKPGQIAGIVVGVIAFVAIVIAVVIIVIKKKNNKDNSSTEVSDQ